MKGLVSALRTLTILSFPGHESPDLWRSLPWFPVVGLIFGLMMWGLASLWTLLPLDPWPAGASLVLVFLEIWLTRGLHLDGLADWADSVGGLHDREKRLAIMKDVRVGAFGVLALVIDVAVKWIAFERILLSGSIAWLVVVFVLARGSMVDLIVRLPYAGRGEGMSRPFISGASKRHLFISYSLCFLVCIPFGPAGVAAFVFAVLLVRVFGLRCAKKFGGITGDLLGTANELVELCLLMVIAGIGNDMNLFTGWAWVN